MPFEIETTSSGMVSHDLRSLLGGLALSTAVLADEAAAAGPSHASYARHAERVQRITGRMTRLVADLLDVVSLEAGKLDITMRVLDPKQLVRDTADTFAPLFSAKGVALETHVATEPLSAAFDHERILQVLANLLGNALKFTAEGGEVSLRVERVGKEVCFTVTDSGVGISPERARNIFERFQQVDPKDRRGLGLGLYIAQHIVVAHGGRIWLQERVGPGSVFRFTLPGVAPSSETS